MVEDKKKSNTCTKIFLSYGHKDTQDIACKLYFNLKELGYDVWIDKIQIIEGKSWEEQIEQAILESKIFIALLSPYAVRRPDGVCLDEISMARYNSKRIIPIMILNCRPPLGIYRLDWVDFQDWQNADVRYKQSFKKLLKAIEHPENGEGNYVRIFGKLKPMDFGAELSRLNRDFIGREWLMKYFNNWLEEEEVEEQRRIFFVIGDPGTGKSAFLAHVVNKHPQVAAYHFCKSNLKDSRDPFLFICSIAAQLATQFEDYRIALEEVELDNIEIREPYDLLRRLIIDPLRNKQLKQPLLIVVDALDEAYDYGLWNIPKILSEGLNDLNPQIRFVVSSRKVPDIVDRFSQYYFHEIDFTIDENRKDIIVYLDKKFSEEKLKEVLARSSVNPDTIANVILSKSEGNFLYVTQAVTALKSCQIDPKKPETFPTGLVGFYLKDFERAFPNIQEHDQMRPILEYDQMRSILEVILAALEPLTANQIAKFLAKDKFDVEMELGKVASYFPEREIEKITVDLPMNMEKSEGKVYQAYHKSIAEWLTGEVGRSSSYRVNLEKGQRLLAKVCWEEYQKGIGNMSSYALAHLPIHLLESERFDDLAILLKDPEFFIKSWTYNEFDIKVCWATIEEKSILRIMDVYQPVFMSPAQYPDRFIFNLSEFLTDIGHIHESVSLLEYLVELYVKANDDSKLQSSLCDLAWAFYLKRDLERSMELLKMQERICKNINHREGLQRCFGYQASIYSDVGEYEEALELFYEQQWICKEINDKYWLQISLGNEGLLHFRKGNDNKAMDLFKEKESISTRIGNLQGFQWSLHYQGEIYYNKGELDRALELYQQQQNVAKEIGYNRGVLISLNQQISIYREKNEHDKVNALSNEVENIKKKMGEKNNFQKSQSNREIFDLAMNLYKEEERKSKENGNLDDAQRNISSRAIIYEMRGELNEALELYHEQENICRKIGNEKALSNSLRNQWEVFIKKEELDSAMELYNKYGHIFTESWNKHEIQKFLRTKGDNHYQKGELEQAMNLYMEQERICKEIGNKKDLQQCFANQGLIHEAHGKFDQALALYINQEQICKDIGNLDHLTWSLTNQGDIYRKKGELNKAMEIYKKQEEYSRNNDNKYWLNVSFGNQGDVQSDRGELESALELYYNQEMICREIYDFHTLQRSLCNQGDIYYKRGELEKSFDFYEKEEEICYMVGNLDNLQRCLGYQAQILKSKGEINQAMHFYKERDLICSKIDIEKWLQISLGNQDSIHEIRKEMEREVEMFEVQEQICSEFKNVIEILKIDHQPVIVDKREMEEEMELCRKKELVCRNIGFKMGLQHSLGNQGIIHYIRNEPDKAMKLFKSQEKICREISYKEGIQITLGRQAKILYIEKELDEAFRLFTEQEQVCLELDNKEDFQICLGRKADIYFDKGHLNKALELYKEQEKICTQVGYLYWLQKAVSGQGRIYISRNEFDQAMKLLKKQEQICRSLQDRNVLALSLISQSNLLLLMDRNSEALTTMDELFQIFEKVNT